VYRDIFHGMRYTPAPMIDFIDGDEQSDFLRQEEVCGLDTGMHGPDAATD